MKFFTRLAATGVVLGLVLTGFATLVNAQDFTPSHIEAAKKAMSASRSTDRLDIILPKMAAEAKAEFIRNRPDQEEQLTAIVDDAALSLAGRRGDLEHEVAQIFAKVFTEEELNTIAEFYSSEAGKKFLKESPIIVREMTGASQIWARGLRRDLGAAIQERLKAAGLAK